MKKDLYGANFLRKWWHKFIHGVKVVDVYTADFQGCNVDYECSCGAYWTEGR